MVVMQDIQLLTKLSISSGDMDSPSTFTQALKDKYVDQDEIDNNFILPKDKNISTAIIYVGFGKVSSVQKQLYRLASIDLSSKNIISSGDLEEIRGSLDQVRILDLANNFLNWDQISSILTCTPRLHDLILTKNNLTSEPTKSSTPRRHRGMGSVTLGQIFLDWTKFTCILSRVWPSIDQLDLWDNKLVPAKMKLDSDEPRDLIQTIKSLKLSFNCFPDLNWLENVGPIQNLVELDISNCKVETITMTKAIKSQLLSLQLLNISYNNIDEWKSISCLYNLENLKNLICHENPIFIKEKHARSLTIGRLGSIKSLNREEITRNMRTDSEIFYIRQAFPEYQALIKGEDNDFKSNHPRYEVLAQEYGLPEDLVRKQTIDKYISVEIFLGDKSISKKLPCDIRVANLKMLCKRLFQLKPSNSISIICCESDPKLSYELDKDGQTLNFFSVKNGRRLMIQQLD